MPSGHEHLHSPLALSIALTRNERLAYSSPRHIQLLSDELVQLWRREEGWPRKLMVFMPPGHAKSETCSHWFPTWAITLEPTTRVIFASYEADFAAKWSRDTRNTLTEHIPVLGVRMIEDSKAGHRWETRAGGGMVAAGVRGPIMGRRGDILIVDDPIKNAEEANSPVVKEGIWDWFNTTFMTRRDSPDSLVVVIMTRWAIDDLAGRILTNESASEWRVIALPALAEADDPLGRPPGAALWPDKFPADYLEGEKRRMGSPVFNALYQQRPVPAEGFAIDPTWWGWYDTPPEEFDDLILTWDTTFKDVASSDYVCGGAIGRKGSNYYLLDAVHQRLNTPRTMEAIRAMAARWPKQRVILIEEAASGPSIIQLLQHEFGNILPIPPVGSKSVRLHWQLNSVAGLIESRQVFLPRAARWARELVAEFRDFPLAPNDDYVDMVTQGLNFLQPRGWSYESRRARAAEPPKTQHEQLSRDMWKKIHKRAKEYADSAAEGPWPLS